MALYSHERTRSSLFHTLAFRAISQIATPLSYVVLVRGLPENDFGIYNLLYSVIPLVLTFFSLGLEQTLRRFEPEYLAQGRTGAAAWLVQRVAQMRFVSTLLLILLVLACWNLVAPLFKLQQHRADFAAFSLVLLLYFQVTILQFSTASHMLHRISTGSLAVLAVGKLITYGSLYFLGALTLRNAIFSDTLAYAAAFALLYSAHRKHCRPLGPETFKADREEKKRLLRYGAFNNFNDAGSILLYTQTDNLFIGAMMNPAAVGAYAFYNRLKEMTASFNPVFLFDNIIQPLFFSIPKHEAKHRTSRYFTFLVDCGIAAQLPFLAYSIVYHREIVMVIFGGKYAELSPLLPIIVAFSLVGTIAQSLTLVVQYAERTSLILLSQLFGLYQIAAMLILVPMLGLYGAVIATGTMHLFRNSFVWWKMRHIVRWTNLPGVLASGLCIWGAAVAAGIGLRAVLHLPPAVDLIMGVVICALATLAYARSPGLATADREILGGVLKGREGRVVRWLGLIK